MNRVAKLLKTNRKARGLSVKDVVAALNDNGFDVAEKTYYGWEGGTRQPDANTFLQLCAVLGISAFPEEIKEASSLTDEAIRIANKYDALPQKGREAVKAVVDIFEDVVAAAPTKIIPFVVQSMAAGAGEPDFGDISLDTYEVPASSKAEFAVRIHGDSLEPYYKDQDVALALKRDPDIGEVGVFLVDGEYKIKQYVADGFGNLYLFAVNRRRADTDQTLWAKDEHTVYCLGTLLMKRPPLPNV